MATVTNFHGCQRRGILAARTGGILPPSNGPAKRLKLGCSALRTPSARSAKSISRSTSTSSGPQARPHMFLSNAQNKTWTYIHRFNHQHTVRYSRTARRTVRSSVTFCQTVQSRLGSAHQVLSSRFSSSWYLDDSNLRCTSHISSHRAAFNSLWQLGKNLLQLLLTASELPERLGPTEKHQMQLSQAFLRRQGSNNKTNTYNTYIRRPQPS